MITDFECGQVGTDFMCDSVSDVKFLMGPVGCGKSSLALVSILTTTLSQTPCHDGIRRAKWVVVRDTYANLHDTTVPTWQAWFPPDHFGSPVGQGRIYHTIKLPGLELQMIFMAIEKPQDVKKLKSLEVTGAYLNECQFIKSPSLITDVYERTMRYPSRRMGGGLGRGLVIADCNPPKTNHWIYHFFERQRRSNWKMFKYPASVVKVPSTINLTPDKFAKDLSGQKWMANPDADYVNFTSPEGYWLTKVNGAPPDYIKVNLCGEYGVVQWGNPVHSEFNDSIHYCRSPLSANPNLPICLGWDFGNTPACVVVQRQIDGRVLVLEEFPTERDYLRPFVKNTVLPVLNKKYPWWKHNHRSRHDPSGMGSTADGKTAATILREFGVNSVASPSNSAELRRDALKYFLTQMVEGQPAILFAESCHTLREGLLGEFHYELLPGTQWDRTPSLKPMPKKNFHSHICESLEYALTEYWGGRKEDKAGDDEFSKLLAQSQQRTDTLNTQIWELPA